MTEKAIGDLKCVYAGSPAYAMVFGLVFLGTPDSESGGASESVACIWDHFPPTSFLCSALM